MKLLYVKKDELKEKIAEIRVPDVTAKGKTPEERRLERLQLEADKETLLDRAAHPTNLVC
jgi:hypothetical protein